jgi:5-methylcytosine-specific restriction endonuclease McrA
MRNLKKVPTPKILEDNVAAWLAEYLADKANPTKRYRYRNDDIKGALRDETGFKCIYCESKIGHNTPGDVEHKIPSSKVPEEHFTWTNLTIACTECNRRKNDYYETDEGFLDPYNEDC